MSPLLKIILNALSEYYSKLQKYKHDVELSNNQVVEQMLYAINNLNHVVVVACLPHQCCVRCRTSHLNTQFCICRVASYVGKHQRGKIKKCCFGKIVYVNINASSNVQVFCLKLALFEKWYGWFLRMVTLNYKCISQYLHLTIAYFPFR